MIKGNTLKVETDGGNIGHSFNDHQFASLSYYLIHEPNIDNIYLHYHDNSDSVLEEFIDYFTNKKLFNAKKNYYFNLNMVTIFFMNENKKFYFGNAKSCIEFENLIFPPSARFFDNHPNYTDVFQKLYDNYVLYKNINNLNNDPIELSILYRTNSMPLSDGRNIINISYLEDYLKTNKIVYKLLPLNEEYGFVDLVNILNNSKNIVCFWGCELTYGMFMQKKSKIIELNYGHHTWWKKMAEYFINYGLIYEVLMFKLDELDNKNLIVNDEFCKNLHLKLHNV